MLKNVEMFITLKNLAKEIFWIHESETACNYVQAVHFVANGLQLNTGGKIYSLAGDLDYHDRAVIDFTDSIIGHIEIELCYADEEPFVAFLYFQL